MSISPQTESQISHRDPFQRSLGRHGKVQLCLQTIHTPLGDLAGLVVKRDGIESLCMLAFDAVSGSVQQSLAELETHFSCTIEYRATPLHEQVITQLEEYFDQQRQVFTIRLYTPGTDFQQRVWAALQRIPYGTTCSYGDIAQMVGSPNASRAVGQANNRNRIPIIIPCHRVIASNHTLHGYGGGLGRKQQLLELEGIRVELKGTTQLCVP